MKVIYPQYRVAQRQRAIARRNTLMESLAFLFVVVAGLVAYIVIGSTF